MSPAKIEWQSSAEEIPDLRIISVDALDLALWEWPGLTMEFTVLPPGDTMNRASVKPPFDWSAIRTYGTGWGG